MKTKILISIILLSVVSVFAGVMLINFNGKSQNGNVILSWETSSESNLKHFIIERKSVKGNFVEIATIEPEADRNYEYVDRSAYKTNDAIYVYRLKIVDLDGSISTSKEIPVSHSNISSVKRTWGSIKALFR